MSITTYKVSQSFQQSGLFESDNTKCTGTSEYNFFFSNNYFDNLGVPPCGFVPRVGAGGMLHSAIISHAEKCPHAKIGVGSPNQLTSTILVAYLCACVNAREAKGKGEAFESFSYYFKNKNAVCRIFGVVLLLYCVKR